MTGFEVLSSHPTFNEFKFDATGIVGFLIALVVVSLFIHFAARIVIDRGGFFQAILVALLGLFAMALIAIWVGGIWGLLLGIAVFALVAALIYRTNWLKGAVIGLVAWVLAMLVMWLVGLILTR